jgi:hypothetical protein
MPAGNKEINIDQYFIMHIARNTIGNGLIRIVCSSGGPSVSRFVGLIDFYPKGQVPASRMDQNTFILNYEVDRYQEIIETLRYEKPIHVNVTWDANNIITQGIISTNPEPIGEQEGV